jgi:hypothetical protein
VPPAPLPPEPPPPAQLAVEIGFEHAEHATAHAPGDVLQLVEQPQPQPQLAQEVAQPSNVSQPSHEHAVVVEQPWITVAQLSRLQPNSDGGSLPCELHAPMFPARVNARPLKMIESSVFIRSPRSRSSLRSSVFRLPSQSQRSVAESGTGNT